jgi:hypothetical protein
MRHRKNAQLIVRDTLSLYGEVLPYRGTRPREALEGLAALTRREA